jgi:hypothetical protein
MSRSRSRLWDYLNGSLHQEKGANHVFLGRKSNDSISRYQEPVGWEFFTETNITIILKAVRKYMPTAEYHDIGDIMLETFWVNGTSKTLYINPDNAYAVGVHVHRLNRMVIDEKKKKLAMNASLSSQYMTLLKQPNVIGKNPEVANVHDTEKQNPRYLRMAGDMQPTDNNPRLNANTRSGRPTYPFVTF